MSIATVVTRGYGSFGSVNLIPTLGYSIGEAVAFVGPLATLGRFQSGTASARFAGALTMARFVRSRTLGRFEP